MTQLFPRSTRALFATALVLFATLGLHAMPAAAATVPGTVNINEADAAQLALLPRVGPSLAGRILEYREANGKFAATEDLILVRGIGEKTFENLEPFVTTEGKTTLDRKLKTSDVEAAKAEKSDAKKDGAEG